MAEGNYDQAKRCFSVAASREPCPSEVYTYRGNAYLELEQFDRSLMDYQEATSRNPEAWDAWASMALAYAGIDEPLRALHAAEKACALKPGDARVLLNRATVNEALGNLDAVISDLEMASQDNQLQQVVLLRLALAYTASSRDALADGTLSRFRDLFGELPNGFLDHINKMKSQRSQYRPKS